MRIRTFVALAVVGVAGIAVATGYGVLHHVPDLLSPDECRASVAGHEVTLATEQAENAALISAISVQRGMPARAASIALATGFQESKLYNLESGDRDSVGLFQQRPSQGWGTREQILNPYYSINAFYDALEKVDGYETMRITEAAQEVQRSGYPEAYADHEADARVLASALTGESAHVFSCSVDEQGSASKKVGSNGLTHRAETVRRDIEAAFGDQTATPVGDGGRAFEVTIDQVGHGWAMAQYLVAMADRLSISDVTYDGHIWSSGSSSKDGWTTASGAGSARLRVSVHR
ncbi:hypothetical protein FB382_002769 [Nocardioides ginsengisegetis]|uniref:ARB-07466-like C-terminal domain-containing protein n=1 Tax=Nocardioides ginsengisegetis TaxID=661491 RepID=A0A7W3PAD1_9ACTN|nr:hypothetical protein [Nocardioides ginsengisegetis]MBA8804478.1 hypothetical protein [Nocardioides ginsengisegetis]